MTANSDHELDRLPRWAPPVVFAVLTLLVFRAYLVAGPGQMLLGQDTIAAGIMMRSFFVNEFQQLHRLPLWNPFLFGGVPTIEAGSGDILYPTSILHFLIPLTSALAWKLIIHVFLAGGFMYCAARALGARRFVALFAGAAYQLSSVLVSLVWGGQDGKMYVITLFPAGVWLLVSGIAQRSWLRFLWLGVVLGLMMIAHPQLAYYAYVTLAAWGALGIWRRRGDGARAALVRVGGGILAGATALAISAVVLFPMFRYLREDSPRAGTGRGFDYAASWSIHAEEVVSLFVPEFAGTDVQSNSYWGKNPFKHNLEYGGAVVLVLGLAGLAGLRGDPRRWGLGAVAAVALLYSLGAGTPFFRLLYEVMPGLQRFRAPSLAMYLVIAAVALLAALVLQRAVAEGDARASRIVSRALLIGTAAALGIAVVAAAGGEEALRAWAGMFGGAPAPRDDAMRANVTRIIAGGLWTAAWCAASWGAWMAWQRGALGARALLAILLGVTVLDLVRVDDRFIQVVRFADYFPDDPGVKALKGSLAPGERVLALPGVFPTEGYLATYMVPEVFGYHGNQLRWYDQLTRRSWREGGPAPAGHDNYWLSFLTSPVLRALAARVVVIPAHVTLPGYELLGGNDQVAVYRNTRALPGAAVVPGVRVEPDSVRALDALWDPAFDVGAEVIVSRPVTEVGKGGGTGKAEFLADGPDSVVIRATTSGPAMLLVSRTWHPSWTATVGGATVPVVRTDYGLIGVPLSAQGEQTVELRYRPGIVVASRKVSLLAWAVVLLATLAAAVPLALRRSARA